jgi:hypothetical protein
MNCAIMLSGLRRLVSSIGWLETSFMSQDKRIVIQTASSKLKFHIPYPDLLLSYMPKERKCKKKLLWPHTPKPNSPIIGLASSAYAQ